MHNPLYFLAYEGRPHIFSGYGIPLGNGQKSPHIGMLIVNRLDRPARHLKQYLESLGL
jgi:hypothetical protein